MQDIVKLCHQKEIPIDKKMPSRSSAPTVTHIFFFILSFKLNNLYDLVL